MRNGITLCWVGFRRRRRRRVRDRAGRGGLSLIFGGVNAIWLILKERDGDGGGGGRRGEREDGGAG